MKKLLSIIVLGLLLSGNGYADNISILCTDEKRSKEEGREVVLNINFDEDGDWIEFGNQKYTNGTKNVEGENITNTELKISTNEIRISHNNLPTLSFIMIINRLDGAMYQFVKMGNSEFKHNYKCEKDTRKF